MGGSHYKLCILLLVVGLVDLLCVAHVHGPGCSHHGHDHHDHHQQFSPAHGHREAHESKRFMLPEELAEEEDLRLYGFQSFHGDRLHHHEHTEGFSELTGVGLWVQAIGCSLLVSMASLICLILLPLMFSKGKPSKAVVDALALFGAGAMLGDAFLHQLPHAFGGEHSHTHNDLEHGHDHGQLHAHSLKDLSVGLSVLGGIVLFLLVEKIVRYVDDHTGGDSSAALGHHHHHQSKKSDAPIADHTEKNCNMPSETADEINGSTSDISFEKVGESDADIQENKLPKNILRKRKTSSDGNEKVKLDTQLEANGGIETVAKDEAEKLAPSNLVFGYLNLFSDGVHNFTDGVALGSAFLLYGSVGGWSRTLFLLAHELPQEIGDFGILVRSGFSVSKALFFNFLSALVALVGTALALLLGQDPGQSSLIEAFTAGGFIYIAVAGVLAEMNSSSNSNIKTTIAHLTFLIMGMGVALCISLVE